MVHAPRAKRAFAPTLALAVAGWLVAASAGVVALTARVVDSPPILVNNFGLGEATIVAFVVHGLAFASVGAVLVVRRPDNAVGRRLILVGLSYSLSMATTAIVFAAWAEGSPERREVAAAAAWWTVLLTTTAGFATFDLALIFPTGQPHSPAWVRFRRIALVWMVAFLTWLLTARGPLSIFPIIDNPIGFAPDLRPLLGERTMLILIGIGGALIVPVPIAAVVARYRAAGLVERQQLRWYISAVAASFLGLGLAAFASIADTPVGEAPLFVYALAGAAVPVAIGIAILRYRLYDIDVVIRRTIVYGAVIAILGALYLALLLALQVVLTGVTGGTLPVALSTLVVAALFRPLQRRVHGTVDRRFYREHYDAQRTLEGFALRLRGEIDLDAARKELVRSVEHTVVPSHVTVWLRARARP